MAASKNSAPGRAPRAGGSRGYFGIGVERASKPMNLGNLFRTAHAFGASFVFTIAAHHTVRRARSDTSITPRHVPYYSFADAESMTLPERCDVVGIELVEEAGVLPSFRHPRNAAYVLGPERGELSRALRDRCDHLVRIPTAFSLNLATAGAIVLYDRLIALGRFARRPSLPGAAPEPPPGHAAGAPVRRGRAGAG